MCLVVEGKGSTVVCSLSCAEGFIVGVPIPLLMASSVRYVFPYLCDALWYKPGGMEEQPREGV